jgi:hypothetical protein
MIKCKKCGADNFSNETVCSICHSELEKPNEAESYNNNSNNQPSSEGMHWFFAWLIMQGIVYAGGWILSQMILLPYIKNNVSKIMQTGGRASAFNWILGISNIEYIVIVLMSAGAVVLWIKLTNKRYFGAGAWRFFTYLWFIVTPLYSLWQEHNAIIQVAQAWGISSAGITPVMWIACIGIILGGVLGFRRYQKNKSDKKTCSIHVPEHNPEKVS